MPKRSKAPGKARHTSLYDALEDRIKKHHATGFLSSDSDVNDDRPRSRFSALPNHALAQRLNVPVDAIPVPDTDSVNGETLPRSDLLNAIHGYTSNLFHQRATDGQHNGLMRSMDESALLTLGMLVEELASEVIGTSGHLMLAEQYAAQDTSTMPADEVVQDFKKLDRYGNEVSQGTESSMTQSNRNHDAHRSKKQRNSGINHSRSTVTTATATPDSDSDSDSTSDEPRLYDASANFGPFTEPVPAVSSDQRPGPSQQPQIPSASKTTKPGHSKKTVGKRKKGF